MLLVACTPASGLLFAVTSSMLLLTVSTMRLQHTRLQVQDFSMHAQVLVQAVEGVA